jgi:hypothetical protein
VPNIPGLLIAAFLLAPSWINLSQVRGGLRSGRLSGRGYDLYRDNETVLFWLMMLLQGALGCAMTAASAFLLYGSIVGW